MLAQHTKTHTQAGGEKAFQVKVHFACAYVLCCLLRLFSGTQTHTSTQSQLHLPVTNATEGNALSLLHVPLSGRYSHTG